ncbi:uncharacterized protein EV154DRAFT_465932 [Mucor mucedo]|uniref:uncharacterized protein n=1 Tax=Mucor mucedo TaxID=29922 RepID=UPI00221F4D8A|nr:uncharacterized protein EV154DRAFT_465932 [Mucor mucedo]KAI7890232.1 hypothetical protein EV154DRAFT_465932 [Mucor mucedo]
MKFEEYAKRRTGHEWFRLEAEEYEREHEKMFDAEGVNNPLCAYLPGTLLEETRADSEYNIGMVYYLGTHARKNYKEAYKCFLQASKYGHLKAVEKIARLYYFGQGVEQDYCKAFEWYKRAAEFGDIESQFRLGILYNDGLGVLRDYQCAFEYYTTAADTGNHVLAMYNLGVLYENGDYVPKDYPKAFELYSKASEFDDEISLYKVATWYEKGRGTAQNYKKAISIYRRLVNDDRRSEAHYRIGRMYDEGHGVSQNYLQAYKNYFVLARIGNPKAQMRVGIMHLNGLGIDKSKDEGIYWLEKAAQGGNDLADAMLNEMEVWEAVEDKKQTADSPKSLNDLFNL